MLGQRQSDVAVSVSRRATVKLGHSWSCLHAFAVFCKKKKRTMLALTIYHYSLHTVNSEFLEKFTEILIPLEYLLAKTT